MDGQGPGANDRANFEQKKRGPCGIKARGTHTSCLMSIDDADSATIARSKMPVSMAGTASMMLSCTSSASDARRRPPIARRKL